MSVRHPKPKQIRLPFDVPRPNKSQAPSRQCGICQVQESRYVCPRCNVPYCSLGCFRREEHAQCSEPFYKNTILEEIRSDPQVGLDEKKGMLEVLRRFEDSASAGADSQDLDTLQFGRHISVLEDQDEDPEEDALAKALEGVDIDNIDTNDLFKLLPQQHRDAFLAALSDPESAATKELLDLALKTGEAEGSASHPGILPWWERSSLSGLVDEEEEASKDIRGKIAERPAIISDSVLHAITPPPGTGRALIWNAVAICIAYLHQLLALRLPSLSPVYLEEQRLSPDDIKEEIAVLVPFLIDPASSVRHNSFRQAWTAVWEHVHPSLPDDARPYSTLPQSMLLRLLRPLPYLLHPPITTSPPSIILVISDLHGLYAKPKASVPRKLAFYAAAMCQLTREEWLEVKELVTREIERLADELPDEVLDDREGPEHDRAGILG